jgi:hypothetical protein
VRLIHWSSISSSKLRVLLDGVPIGEAKFSIGKDGVPSILLHPLFVPGRHRLIVREPGSVPPREATVLFEVVIADRLENGNKRNQKDHPRSGN